MVKKILKYRFCFVKELLCFKAIIFIILFLTSYFNELQAQLVITSPVNDQIIQQSQDQSARISITGYAYFPYSRIEAHLMPLKGNLNKKQLLIIDEEQIKQGFLSTFFNAKTGWYKLTLIGYGTNNVVDSAIISRVGVGEVFLIAGNSNAMGIPGLGSKNASENVVGFNANNKSLNQEMITVAPDEPMQLPEFSPVRSDNLIFPSGETSWYWAELGDMLSKKMNTPVLFMNAAWAAANSENYRDAAMGKDAYNLYVGKTWPNRQPYSNIKNTLRYYNSQLGIRAVLWSHGENDAQLGFTEENYFNNIKTLIEKSRQDFGYKIPWVIAVNSASTTLPNPYQPIVRAQNRLSTLPNFNTYAGPDLDTVQIPRPAHGHFENITGGKQGLTLAALAWNRILSDSLFKNMIPLSPEYAIHTGVVPSKTFPLATFTLPYQITGTKAADLKIHAELLDESGRFVDTIGRSNISPVSIHLPAGLKNGYYKIRIVRSDTILPGSASAAFYIDKKYPSTEYVSSIKARPNQQEIHVSWLVAANPQLKKMTLQKTINGETYTDLAAFDAINNEFRSHLYSFQDQNSGESSIFYRILSEYKNGETAFSTVITVFQEGALPQFVVFPNPVTRQQFYLRSDQGQSIVQCILLDINGREHPVTVTDREVIGLVYVRPIYHLPAGNYILRIKTDSHTTSQTVVFY